MIENLIQDWVNVNRRDASPSSWILKGALEMATKKAGKYGHKGAKKALKKGAKKGVKKGSKYGLGSGYKVAK